jgi:DNA-binding response OmpR family regulator
MLPHRKRVLCVEDDADVCSMITSLLGLLGYEVVSAETVNEALTRIKDEPFDLYLLDNWLPGGSGIELCRTIRERSKSIPVIFYSGAAYGEDKQQALEAGADAYLIKPLEVDKLMETVRRLCKPHAS